MNIVRKPEQESLLRSIGAVHVCNSASPSFKVDLTEALMVTSATLAFDATGGGKLASHILSAMEAAATTSTSEYSRYGSTVRKQVYIYGGLDPSPTVLTRNFGFTWNLVGGCSPRSSRASVPRRSASPFTCGDGTDDDVRKQLHERSLARRRPRPRCVFALRQAGHRGEVSRKSAALT